MLADVDRALTPAELGPLDEPVADEDPDARGVEPGAEPAADAADAVGVALVPLGVVLHEVDDLRLVEEGQHGHRGGLAPVPRRDREDAALLGTTDVRGEQHAPRCQQGGQ